MKWPWKIELVEEKHDTRTKQVLLRVEAVTRRLEIVAAKLEEKLARSTNGTY